MLGDTAVAVHPDDERYRHLIGKQVALPLAEPADPDHRRRVRRPRVRHGLREDHAGARLQRLRGRPAPQPAADQRLRLQRGSSTTTRRPRYRGLDRFEARKRVVADLEAQGLLERITDHTSMIPRGDRSGVVVEPMLTDQWYVRTKPLAEPAIAAVEDGRVKFVPENWTQDLLRLDAQHPGLVHLAPALVGPPHPGVVRRRGQRLRRRATRRRCARKHGLGADVALRQDEDVLDTWFSSALWPFSTLGWPDETPELATFYPTNVLVTSFDIIFFWVARMMMMGLKFIGDVPFREVYIHALVRDHEGNKMSKSKGNIIDPLDLIDGVDLDDAAQEAHRRPHADALAGRHREGDAQGIPERHRRRRHRRAALHVRVAGDDGPRRALRSRARRRLSPLLQQAVERVGVRASASSTASTTGPPSSASRIAGSARGSRATIATVHDNFATYRLDLVAQTLYDFAWHELCDWYLELTKAVLTDPNADARAAARRAAHARRGARRAAEAAASADAVRHRGALARARRADGSSRARRSCSSAFPQAGDFAHDAAAEDEIGWLKGFVGGIRQIRGEANLPRSATLHGAASPTRRDSIARASSATRAI